MKYEVLPTLANGAFVIYQRRFKHYSFIGGCFLIIAVTLLVLSATDPVQTLLVVSPLYETSKLCCIGLP